MGCIGRTGLRDDCGVRNCSRALESGRAKTMAFRQDDKQAVAECTEAIRTLPAYAVRGLARKKLDDFDIARARQFDQNVQSQPGAVKASQ